MLSNLLDAVKGGIRRFADIVHQGGLVGTVRSPRGQDIMAACGQLKSDSEKKSKAELLREAAL